MFRNDFVAICCGRCEDAVVPQLMCARRRDLRGKSGHEFFGLENDMRGSIVPGRTQCVGQSAIGEFFKALDGDGRARRISADAREPFSIASGDEHSGVKTHAGGYGRTGARWGRCARPRGFDGATESCSALSGALAIGDSPLD